MIEQLCSSQTPKPRVFTELFVGPLKYNEVCRLSDVKFSPKKEADRCMSCGSCRDCGMCEQSCYYGAISRRTLPNKSYEYVVDKNKCIGCGFCACICSTGVWDMVENV